MSPDPRARAYARQAKSIKRLIVILFIAIGLLAFSLVYENYQTGQKSLIIKDQLEPESNRSLQASTVTTDIEQKHEPVESKSKNLETNEGVETKFPVHIAGKVKQPGVYYFKQGQIIQDLVQLAGGLDPEADPNTINLAALLIPHQRVYIPGLGEDLADLDIINQAGAEQELGLESGLKIDINSADLNQLCSLPGVGQATAKKIISYREKHGKFNSIEEIMQVPGIKQAKFDNFADLIRAGN